MAGPAVAQGPGTGLGTDLPGSRPRESQERVPGNPHTVQWSWGGLSAPSGQQTPPGHHRPGRAKRSTFLTSFSAGGLGEDWACPRPLLPAARGPGRRSEAGVSLRLAAGGPGLGPRGCGEPEAQTAGVRPPAPRTGRAKCGPCPWDSPQSSEVSGSQAGKDRPRPSRQKGHLAESRCGGLRDSQPHSSLHARRGRSHKARDWPEPPSSHRRWGSPGSP